MGKRKPTVKASKPRLEHAEGSDGQPICGAARDGYNTTSVRHCVTCAKCSRLFESKIPPLGHCCGCGKPLWDGDHNPCAMCNPGALERHGYEETMYDRCAAVMSAAATTSWEHVPQPGYGACSTSTYDSRLAPYLGHLVEGGWVIDKRGIQHRDGFVAAVLAAPLVDTRLEGDAREECPAIDPFFGAALAAGGWWPAAVKMANPRWAGLDSVSVTRYVDYWRGHGARIGRRFGNEVRWEDGAVTAIPEFAARNQPHELDK